MTTRKTIKTLATVTVICAVSSAVALLSGCMATLLGQPSYVGRDPSGRTVYQSPIWEGGGYFVFDNGARAFLKDR